jgi:hypothetical protein
MSPPVCRETRDLLAAFLDGEIPADRRHTLQDHLDACGGCRGFMRMERAFSEEMRARLAWKEAPGGLMVRLRAGLDEIDSRRTERGSRLVLPEWIRWGAWAAAAVLLLSVMLVPALRQYAPGVYDGAVMWATGAERHLATLVCFECEREGVPMDAQRRCHAPGHQTGVRCPGTGLWHLVANDATLPVLKDRSRRGETVVLEGRWLSDIHYVDVRQMRPPGT